MKQDEIELKKITGSILTYNSSNNVFELELIIRKKPTIKYLRFSEIMEIVCSKTGLTPEYLNMKTRDPKILVPRQICHYIASKRTDKSLKDIGSYFGSKDHATVLNSCRKIHNYIHGDKEFIGKYNWINLIC